jgi:hypothetical protein
MWSEVWVQLLERINVVGDPQTKDPARIFYRPQHRPGVVPGFKRQHGVRLDPGDISVFSGRRFYSSPRTTTSSSRHRYWDEAWWNEPQDLSRFNGMTTQQIAVKLRAEFADLRKSLSHTE